MKRVFLTIGALWIAYTMRIAYLAGRKAFIMVPCDWDTLSYCSIDGCSRPATHGVLVSVVVDTDDDAESMYSMSEMVCCIHAETPMDRQTQKLLRTV